MKGLSIHYDFSSATALAAEQENSRDGLRNAVLVRIMGGYGTSAVEAEIKTLAPGTSQK
jgi:hypothetical protein